MNDVNGENEAAANGDVAETNGEIFFEGTNNFEEEADAEPDPQQLYDEKNMRIAIELAQEL